MRDASPYTLEELAKMNRAGVNSFARSSIASVPRVLISQYKAGYGSDGRTPARAARWQTTFEPLRGPELAQAIRVPHIKFDEAMARALPKDRQVGLLRCRG